MSRWTAVRLFVVAATISSILVPAWMSPARTISVPTTLARSIDLSGPGTRRTARVGFAFVPTHVAFSWRGDEGTGFRYRTIEAGVPSRWARAPESHDAERGDLHFSGVLWVGRPDAVEWRTVVPRGATMRPLTLDYLNTLDGPREVRTLPATAGAVARAPDIVTRAQWGADESLKRTSGGCRRRFFPVQQLFVHHTAGSNFDRRPKATMRAIYWYHVVRQGWCDVGYNFVIAPNGRIFEGRWARRYAPWEVHDSEDRRGRAVAGAHVADFNSGSVGVSLMGNYSKVAPSPSMRRSLAELLAWEVDRHDLRPRGRHTYRNPESGRRRRLPLIAGHRDAGFTECPGNNVYRALPVIRRDVAAVIGPGKADSVLTLTSPSRTVPYGEEATFEGTLVDENGVGMPDRAIRTYTKGPRGGWVVGPGAVTGPDGTFSIVIAAEKNVSLVALYDGDRTTWGDESPRVRVRVAPLVTLEAVGGTGDAAGVSHYPPGTTSVPLTGTVEPPHAGRTITVRVSKLAADGSYEPLDSATARLESDGTYLLEWPVDDPAGGSYRAVAVLPAHADHARGQSPPAFFVVDPAP